MSKPRFRYEVATRDEAFIKGMSDDFMSYPSTKVKVRQGRGYILHVNSDRVIPIINREDDAFYEYLFAVNTAPIAGYYGVYADSEEEAFHLFADYCMELVDDEEKPGKKKRRYPGLADDYSQVTEDYDGDQVAIDDFTSGPWGERDAYFFHDGNGMSAEKVVELEVK